MQRISVSPPGVPDTPGTRVLTHTPSAAVRTTDIQTPEAAVLDAEKRQRLTDAVAGAG